MHALTFHHVHARTYLLIYILVCMRLRICISMWKPHRTSSLYVPAFLRLDVCICTLLYSCHAACAPIKTYFSMLSIAFVDISTCGIRQIWDCALEFLRFHDCQMTYTDKPRVTELYIYITHTRTHAHTHTHTHTQIHTFIHTYKPMHVI